MTGPRSRIPPLNINNPIVDPMTGAPTPQFMRLWQQLFGNETNTSEEAAEALALATEIQNREIATGFGLSGGGNLTANRTLSLGNPALADPGADRGLFWDDSAGQLEWLQYGSGLTLSGTTLAASGGAASVSPFLQIAPGVNSGLINTTQIIVTAGFAQTSSPVTGIIFPSRAVPVGLNIIPVMYDGTSVGVVPGSTNLVATGSAVTPLADELFRVPFSAPFTPTVGNLYYVGFSIFGGANFNMMEGLTRRVWFSAGTFSPAPATFPAAPSITQTSGAGWWTY